MSKKQPVAATPSAAQEEELTVTVVRFKGSGETARKGIDAVSQALAAAFGGGTTVVKQISNSRKPAAQLNPPGTIEVEPQDDVEPDDHQDIEPDVPAPASPAAGSAKPKKSLYTFMNELNLSPEGKTPWKEYAAAKNPDGFNERLLVASAWLQDEAGMKHFTGGELFTCFRAMTWRPQADMTSMMRKLKASKSYYDNPEYGKWRLTQPGLDAAAAIANTKKD